MQRRHRFPRIGIEVKELVQAGDLEYMLSIFTEAGQRQGAAGAGQASLQVDQFGEEHAVHAEGVFGAKSHDHLAAAVLVDQTGDFRAQFFEPIFVYLGAQ